MAKGSNSRMKTPLSDSDIDDEIDVFHKQRDVVPLDLDNDALDSDEEDNDQHVFQIEDDSDDDEDEFEEDTDFAAKIAKQHKSLKAKLGGAVDETQDDAEDEEEKRAAWGPGKNIYYVNDKKAESGDEEEGVLRLQSKKTKLYLNADIGLEDDSEEEPTFEENLNKGKT